MTIKGCIIKRIILNGKEFYTVKKTVFEREENAKLYAYYLRIVLNNGGMVMYVKDFEEAWNIYRTMEPKYNLPVWKQWLEIGWKKNEGKYINVKAGMFVVDNKNKYAA